MSFEQKAIEIERCFVKQNPRKVKKYNALLRKEIPFPEVIYLWEELVLDMQMIFDLAKKESGGIKNERT